MKVMIDPKHLQKGMYVAELDRPWLESPFLFQGFRITNIDELEQLDNICEYVFVDPEKSAIPVPSNLSAIPMRSKANRVKTALKQPLSTSTQKLGRCITYPRTMLPIYLVTSVWVEASTLQK